MKQIIELYKQQCQRYNIPFEIIKSIRPYDDTTLFCPSGMQQYKKQFSDIDYCNTLSNIQSCLRLNDLDEIGDGTHFLYFNMIGFFSFRQWTVPQTIDFWMEFLTTLNLKPHYVTIHPNKINEWSEYYTKHRVEIKHDPSNTWSDGNIGGYCTEFYYNDIEIGNIVNPLDTCIDVGFGLERLDLLINGKVVSKQQILIDTITTMIESGYSPSNLKQGYVLRKLLRQIWKMGLKIDHLFFEQEIIRQEKIMQRYERLKDKFSHMPKEWWMSTHGIDLDLIKDSDLSSSF